MKDSLLNVLKNNQKKNIVFYGIAKLEKGMTDKSALFRVYCMDLDMPVKRQGGQILTSWEQVEKENVDAFVVMRQMIAHQGTFRQMLDYCEKHGADIYDEKGRNIGEICRHALKQRYCTKTILLKEIQSHERISFDIFDTLLMRKVLVPEDVFALTARRAEKEGIVIKNFKEKRMKSQEELGLTNPDIYQIYERLKKKYHLESSIVKRCLEIEMEIEREVLIAREEMVEVYRQCLQMGKAVSLVSDMYIPEKLLVEILDKNGIQGYDNIYISCDKKQLKLQGLLETYQDENPAVSYLHVGDQLIHDGICAGLAQIDYCLVANSYKVAQKSMFSDCICKAQTLEEHVMLGLIFANIYNSPFSYIEDGNGIVIRKDYDYGYVFCAALITQLVLWLYEEVSKGGYDEILFASRDGYLVQRLYELLLEKKEDDTAPRGMYFYTSRKAAVMTSINNEAYINMIIDISEGMSPKKIMRERFGIPASKVPNYDMEKYQDSIHKYIWDNVDMIFARSEQAKINYYKYMGRVGLEIGKKYAFMDFVSSGTSQKSLMRIAPFELYGLYAGWNGSEEKESVRVNALFEGSNTCFMKRFKIMETFLTSEEPSLEYFDDNGNPVFATEDRTEKELQYVKIMQDACMDFMKEFLGIINPRAGTVHNEFTDSVFAISKVASLSDTESVLNHLRLTDDWRKKRNKVERLLQ